MAKDTVEKQKDPRQAEWEAFLVQAEEQRKRDGTLHIFLAQKEAGEFDTIPASFGRDHNITRA